MIQFLIDEPATAVQASLADALDLVDFGVVLLNRDGRARFINRAFREIWQVPDHILALGPHFRTLLQHGANSGWYDVHPEEMADYLAAREAAVAAGEIPPTEIDMSDGRRLLFRCIVCPDGDDPQGGRIITYTDITRMKHEQALMQRARDAAERIGLELRYSNASLESQAAYLASLAEAAEHAAAQADQARRQLEAEIAERRELEEQLRLLATTDGLTGALNRRQVLSLGDREIERARRMRQGLAVLMLDIDHFKRINDTRGHFAGDIALKQLVTIVTGCIRRIDLLGRYGGEEFVVVLPAISMPTALLAAERIRKAIAAEPVAVAGRPFTMTASIGLACLRETDATLEAVLVRADVALYAAKTAGRNRVECEAPA